MQIRDMKAEDVYEGILLGRKMHHESVYRHNDWDEKKLWALWNQHVQQPNTFCFKMAEHDGEMIGIFVGVLFPHFFGNDIVCQDLILFVKEEHRGGTAALRLIKAYEQWGRENGVKEIQIGVSTGVHPERTAKLFEKMGFGDKAIYFRKRI